MERDVLEDNPEWTLHLGVGLRDCISVASGALRAGERVSSVRELARELAINPNTIARAYRQLQDDEVLLSVRGTGLEVAAGAAERCRSERLKLIRTRLRQVLTEAKQSRLDPQGLRDLVDKELRLIEKDGNQQ